MDEEGADERDDTRGGRHQGIVVEIPCNGQIGCSAVQTTEGNSFRGARECSGVRPGRVAWNAKQTIEATLELAVRKDINSVHGIPPESEPGAGCSPVDRTSPSSRRPNPAVV